MSKKINSTVINDPKIEKVLQRLHQEANNQTPRLILHYLPKLPGLFTGKGIKWDKTKTDFYKDKYIPIEPDQGNFLYLLGRSINAKNIVEFGTSFGISTIYLAARSEEHTSELQSHVRISYAVFCLKKKKNLEFCFYLLIIPLC